MTSQLVATGAGTWPDLVSLMIGAFLESRGVCEHAG
jgi:hypothetical protein